jgi:hypothetical protein
MSPRLPFHVLGIALLVLGGSALVVDPARGQVTETTITLTWTAPGDDGVTGQPARYDLRRSRTAIVTYADFNAATPVTGVPVPAPAGTAETATATGLTPNTRYWFALRTVDEAGNWSELSNVVSVVTSPSNDTVRPARVPLVLDGTGDASATISWNDVGDDSLTGDSSGLEIRWANFAITEANWETATVVAGVPAPGPPGTAHQLTVTGLDRTRDLWFAARAWDDVNQLSGLGSSLPVPRLLDTAPPAPPTGVSASVAPVRNVHLRWTANAEPDLAGYHVYRSPTATGTLQRITSNAVATNEHVDPNAPDSASLWYAVSAVDATGNESARSARYQVSLAAADIAGWNVLAPFPNPSPLSGPVNIPLEVPAAGPYDATLDIQDAAGQHVRSLAVRGLQPGPYLLQWDGRNDAGRATAPGLYRAWLRAGDTRRLVKIVRTP